MLILSQKIISKNHYGLTKIFCKKSVVPPRRTSPMKEKMMVYITNDNDLCVLLLLGSLLIIHEVLKYY